MSDFLEITDSDGNSLDNSALHKDVDSVFDDIVTEVAENIEPVTTNDTYPENDDVEVADDSTPVPEEVNYEEFYKEMMSPIKANGKTLSIQSAQEARQLIQMGANYTKKMQEIAPQRKILEYLKQNNITSEKDVLYLVDLANGNETAVQKWIQDKNIDLNEIASPEYDDDGNPKPVQYIPSSSMPDDKYMAANTVMADIQQTTEGYNFIRDVCSWDAGSRSYLYDHPEIMYDLQTQKQNGIFDTVASEVERRKAVGSLPPTMDFITAYAQVGTELNNRGLLTPNSSTGTQAPQYNSVVTKPYIQHGNTTMQNQNNNYSAQVRSAGLTRMNNSSVKPASRTSHIKNLYDASSKGDLSGDEFIQQFNKLFKINE